MEKQMTERGQLVINELADALDFWMQGAVLERLGLNDIEDLKDPWNPVEFTEAEGFLLDIGQDVYDAIATLPEAPQA